MIEKYDGRCNRCGITDHRVLQIDHVKSGGNADRKTCKGAGIGYLTAVLADDSGKYQLLCANCNWIKRWETQQEHGGSAEFGKPSRPQIPGASI